MNLKYYADVKDRANNAIRLEIYVPSFSGTAEEILLQADSISIEYTADTLFDALKPSLAHINILSQNLKTDLYSSNYNDIIAKIYKNTNLFWVGYVTPNIYNQPYAYNYDPITLECIDIVSNLGNMKYNSNAGITSLLSIIGKCLALADPNHLITNIYVDSKILLDGDSKLLDYAYLYERNFYDEKMEPQNCDEVIGSILKCFGLTMVQYKDAFYIVEQGSSICSSYTLNKYTYDSDPQHLGWFYNSQQTLTLPVRNSDTIGVAASNGQISLDNVYNKVTVIANNNPLDAMLPDFNDKDDLENQDQDSQHYDEWEYTINDTTYKLLAAYFTSKNNWVNYTTMEANLFGNLQSIEPVKYNKLYFSPITPGSMTPETGDSLDSHGYIIGALWNKAVDYKKSDGDPATLSWKTYLSMFNYLNSTNKPYLELRKKPTMIFDGGYLIVNLEYKLSTSRYPHSAIKSTYNDTNAGGICTKTWSDDTSSDGDYRVDGWPNYTMFPCLIKIGDYFYDGEEWILQSIYDNKKIWWNSIYDFTSQGFDTGTHTWYRIYRERWYDPNQGAYIVVNDWEYVTQSTYDDFRGTKESGETEGGTAPWILRNGEGDTHIYYTDDFVYRYAYGNYCFLMRKNIAGEQIMDATYKLTNTVSYKMKIINATEGMSIKINNTMFGELQFKLFDPIDNISKTNILGRDPQYQNHDAERCFCMGVHISNLTLKYQKTNEYQDIFNSQDIDPDTIYTNVISGNYCKELEDITLTVNTANDWANSYSYLIKQNEGGYDYIKSLSFNGNDQRPEERLINKYVNYYNTPKYQYGNTLFNSKTSGGTEIYPFQPITETLNGYNKNFIVNSITYDMGANTVNINAHEI